MRFTCDKQRLLNAISIVQRAIMPNPNHPILESIMLDADAHKGTITMSGSSSDMYIVHTMECNITEGGKLALASKMFGEIIRRMPMGDISVSSQTDNFVTKIKSGRSMFNIQGLSCGDFPNAPKMEDGEEFVLSQRELKNMIKKTISFTMANPGKRPALSGDLFEIKDGVLNVVASDGRRLAVISKKLSEDIKYCKFVIPGFALKEIFKVLADEGDIRVRTGTNHVLFEFDDFVFYTRLIIGDFIRYEPIIKSTNPIEVTVDNNLITDGLERALLIINEEGSNTSDTRVPVRLDIYTNKIDMTCLTGKGQTDDSFEAETTGGELTIGFNCKYLLDAFRACEQDVLKLQFSTPLGGCFIRTHDEGMNAVFMVLPVKIK